MARSIWKGNLSVGLVNVPVALYKATDEAKGTAKRWLHAECLTPINQRKICTKCAKDNLEMSEIIDGVEQLDGTFVLLTKEEIAAIRVKTTDTILVESFVPASSIDSIYVDSTYYLGPSKKTPGFAILRDAMRIKDKVMTGRLSIYGRERFVVVRPLGPILVLQLLHTNDELRSFEDLPNTMPSAVDPKQLELATKLVEMYAGSFDPTMIEDTYVKAFNALVEAKKYGKQLPIGTSEVAPTMDFMAAIVASLAAKQPAKKKSSKKNAA